MASLRKAAGLDKELGTSSEDGLDDSSESSSAEGTSDDNAEDRPAKRQKLEPSFERLEEQTKTLEAEMRGQRSTNKQAMAMIRKLNGIISNFKRELKDKLKKEEDNTYKLRSAKNLIREFKVANRQMSLEMQDLKKTIHQKDSQIADLEELGRQRDTDVADLKSTIDKMTQENKDVRESVLRAFGVDLDSK